MSGLDFIRAAKTIRSDLPCLLCTGQIGGAEGINLAASGVAEVLRKPVALAELFAAIKRAAESDKAGPVQDSSLAPDTI
jgi:DNA-binding NtrC family response regulator